MDKNILLACMTAAHKYGEKSTNYGDKYWTNKVNYLLASMGQIDATESEKNLVSKQFEMGKHGDF